MTDGAGDGLRAPRATTCVSPDFELGIYPAVDTSDRLEEPARASSREHYRVARVVRRSAAHKDLQDIIASSDRRASEDDKLTVARARKIQRFLSQPFFVAEQFTGLKGRYVKIADTIEGFDKIAKGELDEYPEQAFLYKGTIDEVVEHGKRLASGG